MLANGNPASAESRDGEEKGHKGKQYLHAVLKSFSSSVSSFKFWQHGTVYGVRKTVVLHCKRIIDSTHYRLRVDMWQKTAYIGLVEV